MKLNASQYKANKQICSMLQFCKGANVTMDKCTETIGPSGKVLMFIYCCILVVPWHGAAVCFTKGQDFVFRCSNSSLLNWIQTHCAVDTFVMYSLSPKGLSHEMVGDKIISRHTPN